MLFFALYDLLRYDLTGFSNRMNIFSHDWHPLIPPAFFLRVHKDHLGTVQLWCQSRGERLDAVLRITWPFARHHLHLVPGWTSHWFAQRQPALWTQPSETSSWSIYLFNFKRFGHEWVTLAWSEVRPHQTILKVRLMLMLLSLEYLRWKRTVWVKWAWL